jgi:DdrB-like protein
VKGTLPLVNALGHQLTAHVDGDPLAALRELGAQGWSPLQIPAGGIHLPYAMADAFDWSLIGARQFAYKDGNEEVIAVEHLGHVYTRRSFAASGGKKKMPAAIKYSRGAKETDPDAIVEKVEGEVGKGYVTLALFRGAGPLNPAYTRQAGVRSASGPPGDTVDQDVGHRGARRERAAEPETDPLSALTAGQRTMIGRKLAEAKIDPATSEGKVLLRGMVFVVMGSNAPLDAVHIPALIAKIKERAAA